MLDAVCLLSSSFYINRTTGMIYTKVALDREVANTHIITVVATDSVIDYRNSYVQVRLHKDD